MNLEVLEFLLENESYIKKMAVKANANSNSSFGVLRFLIANSADASLIKGDQYYHYRNIIKPLLDNVQCVGSAGMREDENGDKHSTCVNGGIVDDEVLYQSYVDEDFKCQTCRHDSEFMG